MFNRFSTLVPAACLALALQATSAMAQQGVPDEDGLIKVRSAYPVDETVSRIRNDIAAKGIRYFMTVDQAKLAADAGIAPRPSTLMVFGNPPLGVRAGGQP